MSGTLPGARIAAASLFVLMAWFPSLEDARQGVVAVVLGTAQDGGVPQVHCSCDHCSRARADTRLRRRAASLALLDAESRSTFLIDATPDLPEQLQSLLHDPALPLRDTRTPLDGLLLTHAHVGHYAGLIYFGREVLGSGGLPVYGTERMLQFLSRHAPWSLLVRQAHVDLRQLEDGRRLELTPRLHITPILVPHRDEISDTVAFLAEGPRNRLLWLPDIDRWEGWERELERLLEEVDHAFLDATFFDASELPDRNVSEIPHPPVPETVRRVRSMGDRLRARVYLIHLNHTNPLLDGDSEAAALIGSAGIEVARDGQRVEL